MKVAENAAVLLVGEPSLDLINEARVLAYRSRWVVLSLNSHVSGWRSALPEAEIIELADWSSLEIGIYSINKGNITHISFLGISQPDVSVDLVLLLFRSLLTVRQRLQIVSIHNVPPSAATLLMSLEAVLGEEFEFRAIDQVGRSFVTPTDAVLVGGAHISFASFILKRITPLLIPEMRTPELDYFNPMQFVKPKADGDLGTVLHLGAYLGAEVPRYFNWGFQRVILVEPDIRCVASLVHDYGADPRVTIIPKAVAKAAGTIDFTLNMNPQLNSVFEIDHEETSAWTKGNPEIVAVPCAPLHQLIDEVGVRTEEISFVNMDIQGSELIAIESGPDIFRSVDLVQTEMSFFSVYRGMPLFEDICKAMGDKGFSLIDIWSNYEWTWGDGVFRRL